ncbi:MAG: hypothetical protein IH880_08110 [Candidatus Marinimicrobia bacterium]|nr:hypothetical protein [Candidatus Neomarinimicrobiota bacterium]
MKSSLIFRILIVMLISLLFTPEAFAGKLKNERGFGIVLTNKGVGAGYSYNWKRNPYTVFTSEFEIISIKGKGEFAFQVIDQFGRVVNIKIGDRNLLLFPVFFGYRRHLWVDQLVSNMRPYVQLSGGPVLAFDLTEGPDVGFIDQFRDGKAYYTIGIRFSGGALIQTSKKNFINLNISYSIIDFGVDLDGRRPLGEFAFRAEFGSWLR